MNLPVLQKRPRTIGRAKPATRSHADAEPPGEARTPKPTPDRILQIAWGYAPPLILATALHYQVFDRLEEAPQTAEELAARCAASTRGFTAILNALVGLNLLGKTGDRYVLTPESEAFLVSTKPAYHGDYFRHATRQLMPRWLKLTDVVRTGHPVVAANQSETAPEFFSEFVESLFPLNYQAARALGEHLGIPKVMSPFSVLDIGAGSGVWGIALAHQSPFVRVLAVDWPVVLEITRRVARQQGIGERLRTSEGDLLDADFGGEHQMATIGHILHGEGRDRSRQLLKKTYSALAPGGTIAISEFMPNAERTGPSNALIFSVNMLIHTEAGDTFTFEEIAQWLREAGFESPRLLEAPAPSPLVLANKPR
jgi:SAM-dependent methyltransferase